MTFEGTGIDVRFLTDRVRGFLVVAGAACGKLTNEISCTIGERLLLENKRTPSITNRIPTWRARETARRRQNRGSRKEDGSSFSERLRRLAECVAVMGVFEWVKSTFRSSLPPRRTLL